MVTEGIQLAEGLLTRHEWLYGVLSFWGLVLVFALAKKGKDSPRVTPAIKIKEHPLRRKLRRDNVWHK
jgi:hypothetical protein